MPLHLISKAINQIIALVVSMVFAIAKNILKIITLIVAVEE